MESCPSLGGEFDQLDCLLGCDEFVEFDGEDLCSSVVEQVLGFCSDGDPDLVAGDAWFGGVVEEEENSSETTARPGRDRARTLVSERRRRGRMKDKLYELRSMVPNITKMDKASIIGDAISYVKDLQKQARMLTEEIARLESSAEGAYRSPLHPREREKQGSMDPLPKRAMLEFSGCGLGDKRFHLRLVCQNGEGTPAAVYRALEKLTFLHQESSTLSTCSEKREVTLTVKVAVESRMLPVKCSISSFRFGLQGDGYVGEIDVSVLKPWVMTALLDEGFGFNVEVTP